MNVRAAAMNCFPAEALFTKSALCGIAFPRLMFTVAALFMLVLASLHSAAAETGKRVALVIGNSHYAHVESLENPVNDAEAMESRLRALGFEVFAGKDLTLAEFKALSARFQEAAKPADTAIIYFSGHGFQFHGENFVVPADAALKTMEAISQETVRLNDLIASVQSRERQVLVFLDACRNNPLPPAQRKDNGLAQVATDNNVFVAFATQPGNISYDGRSKLSPFTKSLVGNMGGEQQSISDLMISVRNDVEKMTLGQQTPWDQSSLKKQFYFNPDQSGGQPGQSIASLGATAAPGSEISALQRSTTIDTPNTSLEGVSTFPGSNVIMLPEAPVEIFGKEDLVTAVQSELKRVGCYEGDANGVWSSASREALSKYYRTKKLRPTDSDPTEFHLGNLKSETGIVCLYVPPKKPIVRAYARPAAPKAAARPAVQKPGYNAKRNEPVQRAAKPVQRTPQVVKSKREIAQAAPRRVVPPPPPKKNSLADANIVGGFR